MASTKSCSLAPNLTRAAVISSPVTVPSGELADEKLNAVLVKALKRAKENAKKRTGELRLLNLHSTLHVSVVCRLALFRPARAPRPPRERVVLEAAEHLKTSRAFVRERVYVRLFVCARTLCVV